MSSGARTLPIAMRLLLNVRSPQTVTAPISQLGSSDIISPPTQNIGITAGISLPRSAPIISRI